MTPICDGRRATRYLILLVCAAGMMMLLAGCRHHKRAAMPRTPSAPSAKATKQQPADAVRAIPVGHTEVGTASWYGVPYHGRPAADGEIYNMETLVAAHRTMPFNTWLKVTNLANDRSVNVRIIDRGPFVGGRIIDLSKAAAREIQLLGPGVGKVRLQVISAPVDIPAEDFYGVQVGAFAMRENAERLRARYADRYGHAQLALKQGTTPLWRVLVGRESSVDEAQQLAAKLSPEIGKVFIVRLDRTPERN